MKTTHYRCDECGHIFALKFWSSVTPCTRCGGLSFVYTDRDIREDRLRDLGYEDVSEEERKKNIALNIALLDWQNTDE